jgi:hypothetical protein
MIIIDKETINNKNTLPVLSIPKTEMINGAQAKEELVYRVQLRIKKSFSKPV